jgi:hypothetical protein
MCIDNFAMKNATDYQYLLQKSYTNLAFGCTVLIITAGIIGIIGNSSIIFFYCFRIDERGERYFIPLLAIVDLCVCFSSFIHIFIDNTYYYNYPSDFVCRIHSMIELFLPGIFSSYLFKDIGWCANHTYLK